MMHAVLTPVPQDMVGAVGFSVPGITWRLAALEDMGYDPLGQPARGELCLRGDTMFSGYHLACPALCLPDQLVLESTPGLCSLPPLHRHRDDGVEQRAVQASENSLDEENFFHTGVPCLFLPTLLAGCRMSGCQRRSPTLAASSRAAERAASSGQGMWLKPPRRASSG